MTERTLLKRIVVDPKIMLGKPVIKGTRLPVDIIVGRIVPRKPGLKAEGHNMKDNTLPGSSRLQAELPKVAYGKTVDGLRKDYPFLKKDDVRAALLYAAKRIANEEVFEA